MSGYTNNRGSPLADFDFDIARVANGPVEEGHLVNGDPLEMIAGDAAGGAFMRAGAQAASQWPIVYVESEGEGGLIAMSLRDTLGIIVGVPSLHDALDLSYDDGARLRA